MGATPKFILNVVAASLGSLVMVSAYIWSEPGAILAGVILLSLGVFNQYHLNKQIA